MTKAEILDELKKLPPRERLGVVEAAIHLLREELQNTAQPTFRDEAKQQMADAAKALLQDYQQDDELTCFTVLDGEAFHEER